MFLSFALESLQEALVQSHKLLTWLDLGSQWEKSEVQGFWSVSSLEQLEY